MWWLDLIAVACLLLAFILVAAYTEEREKGIVAGACAFVFLACLTFYEDSFIRANAVGCQKFNGSFGLDSNRQYRTLGQVKDKDGTYAIVRSVDTKENTWVRCVFAKQELPPIFEVGSDDKILELGGPMKNQ